MFEETFVRCAGYTNPNGSQYMDGYFRMDDERTGLDYESARDVTPRWYGVAFGNGNDGVSHMYPRYYVRTCDPWRLAALAIVDSIIKEHQDWAEESVEVDGESDYTISATLYEGPDGETEFGAAWYTCEVFPVELGHAVDLDSVDDGPDGSPSYDGLLRAFGRV